MRPIVTRVLLALAGSFAAATPLLADEVKMPLRKAGQWELKTIMDEGNGPHPEHAMQLCIDDKMEASTAEASRIEHQNNCSSYKVTAEGGTTVMEADCKFGRQVTQSRTEMSGDFQKTFNIKITSSTMQSGGDNKSTPVKRTITQTGTYVGEKCQDGLMAGEALDAKGNKMLVQ